ncbi:MAG: glycosyltransferase [Gemmatimonadetes bacterium]|nr:glycosyltransferase [Gemmatimonadota bacterium]
MGRLILATFGSLGDLHPMIALGRALAARGHDIGIATSGFYRDAVESTGLGFHPVRPDVDPGDRELFERAMHPRKGPEVVIREWVLPSLRESFEDTLEASAGADVVVSGDVAFQAPLAAEAAGAAWASITLSPASFLSAHDPPVLPVAPWLERLRRLGPIVNRLVPRAVRLVTRSWFDPVRRLREELGLPPAGHPLFEGKHSDRLVLAMFSRVLAEPQPDWPEAAVTTGFAFHDRSDFEPLSPDAFAFLEGRDRPIVFALGSAASRLPGDWWEVALGAARSLDRRAVLVLGPEPGVRPGTAGPDVLVLDYAPYSEVFPKAAAVVHQGGMGTLGQALRAGRPQLVVPFAHDQPDNAARAERTGVARSIPRREWSVRRAVEALEELLADPGYERRAEAVASVVRSEGGAKAAAAEIEREFADELGAR